MQLPAITRIPRIFKRKLSIIDTHVYTFFEHQDFVEMAHANGAQYDLQGLKEECRRNNVEMAFGVYNDVESATTLTGTRMSEQCKQLSLLHGIGVINPLLLKKDSLAKTEAAIANGTFKALKVMPGHYPAYCTDPRFTPFYKLAGKYDVPVFIHTGDTMGEHSYLKYARPLHVDELAVNFPATNFIMTKMGNPWFVDAAEVAYKNDNVYLGTAGLFSGLRFSRLYIDRLKYCIEYIDDPRKFIYGSDWPLVRMQDYIKFISSAFPRDMHQKLFCDNARKLFKL